MRLLIDEAPQFIKALDQVPLLFQQWHAGCGDGESNPMRTLVKGLKSNFNIFLDIKEDSSSTLLILSSEGKCVKWWIYCRSTT